MNNSPISVAEINQSLPQGLILSDHLKSGGQGAVFRGSFNGESCAVKVINKNAPEISKRIERELHFLKGNNCPNIVNVLFDFEISLRAAPFIVLVYEFIPGGDLVDRYASSCPLENDTIAKIGLDVSKAIKEMWSCTSRIVHRDIKPANIMMRDDGTYLLVDLAFARHIDMSDITIFGTRGTQGYMSPEQVLGRKNLTFKSDIFALGVTLYTLATNVHPYRNQQPTSDFSCQGVTELNGSINPSLSDLIGSMMSTRAIQRPTNIVEKFEELMER